MMDVVLREVWFGRAWRAGPMRLVEERDGRAALFRPPGTIWKIPVDESGRLTRRTPVGFDTKDEKLDLIVRRDGSFEWKDEDELAEAARRGLLDEAEVRSEAERVVANPPWPTGWEDFRPNPAWPPPKLPPGWDAP